MAEAQTIKATVLKKYNDRITKKRAVKGSVVSLTKARFDELKKHGYVEEAK